jgi:hypothetical protein
MMKSKKFGKIRRAKNVFNQKLIQGLTIKVHQRISMKTRISLFEIAQLRTT